MRELELINSTIPALIDDEYYEEISSFDTSWSLAKEHSSKRNKCIYTCKMTQGKTKRTYLHRLVMQLSGKTTIIGQPVDHINGNIFDNQKHNLRICTNRQNGMNRGPNRKNKKSQFKGVVVYENRPKPYAAFIHVNYKTRWLGYHQSEEEAAKVYDLAALEHFGEFARLNFPKTEENSFSSLTKLA